MREDWKIKSLGEIAEIKGGKRLPKGYKFETIPTSHPYITVTDFAENGTVCTKNIKYISSEVHEKIKSYTISSHDLYISIAGTIGKTGLVPKSLDGANLTENACKLVFHQGIDKKFIYYFTKTDSFVRQTSINTRIAAQPKLALVRLKTITLPMPPLPEQKRIVAIVDQAFEGIDRAIANTKKNLTNARELFESYLNAIFTQKGDGWMEKKLHGVVEPSCSLSYGIVQPGNDYENGLPIVRPTNLTTKTIKLGSLKRIDPVLADSYKRTKLRGGELLLCVRGSTGVVGIAVDELKGANVTRGIVPIRFEQSLVIQAFGYYMLISKMIQEQIREKTYGTALMQINICDLRDIVLSFPKQEEQQTLVEKLDRMENETQRLEAIYQQKLAALTELKQSILQKAFTGELTADNANQATKAAKEVIAA